MVELYADRDAMNNNPREDGFIRIGESIITFDQEDLTDEVREIAEKRLGETPEVREAALKKLQELVKGDKDLYFPAHNRGIYLLFLRGSDFDTEETFKLIKRYYTFKLNHPKLCKDLLPSTEKNAFLARNVGGIPHRDRHGRRMMMLYAGGDWDPRKCSTYEFVRAVVLAVKIAAFEPKTQVLGGVVILDLENMGLTQALQFSPRMANNILTLIQECMPVRLTAVHVVNQSLIFDVGYAIFKPFMNQQFRSMLHLHGNDRESLIEDIGAKYLPVKYGGDLDIPVISGVAVHELLCHFEEEFRELSTYGYKNKKRRSLADDLSTID